MKSREKIGLVNTRLINETKTMDDKVDSFLKLFSSKDCPAPPHTTKQDPCVAYYATLRDAWFLEENIHKTKYLLLGDSTEATLFYNLLKFLNGWLKLNKISIGHQYLSWSIQNGHEGMTAALLQDKRTCLSKKNVFFASTQENIAIIKLVFAHLKMDSKDYNKFILNAVKYRYVEVVKFLLTDKRVNPAVNQNEPICRAAANGDMEIVKMLLVDPRVDSSDNGNEAIFNALLNGYIDIAKILLWKNGVFDTTIDDLLSTLILELKKYMACYFEMNYGVLYEIG